MRLSRVKAKNKKKNNAKSNIYLMLSKIFALISFLILFIVIIIAIGTIALGLDPNWAILTFESWAIIWCVLTAVFIFVDIFLYIKIRHKGEIITERKQQKEEILHGKKIFVYTHPENAEGGIFSKTYIPIDENSVLRLRELIVTAKELWGNKENN
ncbi:MAG: hypothetical protein JXA91_02670 [Candidatus Thermoplasmatota archaeon]|nr:hypothetical protein [Candidatus Thermoplasmatota archaeon]